MEKLSPHQVEAELTRGPLGRAIEVVRAAVRGEPIMVPATGVATTGAVALVGDVAMTAFRQGAMTPDQGAIVALGVFTTTLFLDYIRLQGRQQLAREDEASRDILMPRMPAAEHSEDNERPSVAHRV